MSNYRKYLNNKVCKMNDCCGSGSKGARGAPGAQGATGLTGAQGADGFNTGITGNCQSDYLYWDNAQQEWRSGSYPNDLGVGGAGPNNNIHIGCDSQLDGGPGSRGINGVKGHTVGSIAIGPSAGCTGQKPKAIAIGSAAGKVNQQSETIAIGWSAGENDQQDKALAIGYSAGYSRQQAGAIAIGSNAGRNKQGSNAIAIGFNAGITAQESGSIIINATGIVNPTSGNDKGFYVAPVRPLNDPPNADFQPVYYNPNTGEFAYMP
jgi:hypothetical protein